MGFARDVADEVVFMDRGKIIERNDSESFFDNPQSDRAQDIPVSEPEENAEKGKPIKYLEYDTPRIPDRDGRMPPVVDIMIDEFARSFGKVKAGELSIHIMILSKHRKEAIKAMDWFIFELKKNVPIWKWAILNDGRKIPSDCMH